MMFVYSVENLNMVLAVWRSSKGRNSLSYWIRGIIIFVDVQTAVLA